MASLYGIETEDGCREKMDELLELCRRAERAMNKLEIAILKSRLEEDYKEGDTQEGRDQMSDVESTFYWPAIRDAYEKAPKLTSPKMWPDGLNDIVLSLRHYRPKEHKEHIE